MLCAERPAKDPPHLDTTLVGEGVLILHSLLGFLYLIFRVLWEASRFERVNYHCGIRLACYSGSITAEFLGKINHG